MLKLAHILEGLVKALDNLDAVIELIRAAKNGEEARTGLCRGSVFWPKPRPSWTCASSAPGLERQKIVDEYKASPSLPASRKFWAATKGYDIIRPKSRRSKTGSATSVARKSAGEAEAFETKISSPTKSAS